MSGVNRQGRLFRRKNRDEGPAPGTGLGFPAIRLGGARSCRHNTRVDSPAPTKTNALVNRITGWRRMLVWPLGLLVRVWGRTLRFEIAPEDYRTFRKIDEPVAFVLWHNRLFLVAEMVRRYRQGRPIHALVSASKDGAWLDAFFSLVGIATVRGSSSRLGREAASALIDTLRSGRDIGLTPDGPKGPCYDFKAGGLIVPRRAQAPILLVGAEFGPARQLKSWDRFYLPRPFSTIRIHCELVSPETLAGDRDEVAARLRQRLLEINPDRG